MLDEPTMNRLFEVMGIAGDTADQLGRQRRLIATIEATYPDIRACVAKEIVAWANKWLELVGDGDGVTDAIRSEFAMSPDQRANVEEALSRRAFEEVRRAVAEPHWPGIKTSTLYRETFARLCKEAGLS